MQIDPSKSAVQNLLALVDASNPSAPNLPSEVTVSNLTSGSYANGADTKVTLTGTGPQGQTANFTGSVDVTYKRLALAAEAVVPSTPPTISVWSSKPTALAAILAYYGYVASEVTAPSMTIPTTAGADTVSLQASGSLIYEDGSTNVNVNWQRKTILLMHFDGGITDAAGHTTANTGTAGYTNASAKFGSGSFTTAAVNAYTSITDATDLHLTSGEWTIEFWLNPTNVTQDTQLIDKTAGARTDFANRAWVELNATALALKVDGTSSATLIGSGYITTGWQHIAIVQHAGTLTIYRNGVSVGSMSNSASWGNNSGNIVLGNNTFANNSNYVGYLDELRISNVARYTANFTAPTAAFALD
ncbi:hypothetical protein [Burkholderia phage FLC9]|nr:hypothetical protein [Burkholderia phage FLC9]